MDAEVLEKYVKAGQVLAEVLKDAAQKVDVGVPLLDVAEFVEESIISKGAKPAFPCNISLDRAAAHYTPSVDDKSVFGENMVKLDVGVHVDGYIADAALTVDLSGHDKLTEATKTALEAAIELVKPGVNTKDLGAAIEDAITGYGYKPVGNLTGHGLLRYEAHAEPSIPNRAMDKGVVLKAGDVIAIEPFATDGQGRISEAPITEIYGLTAHRPVRLPQARDLMKDIKERYRTLPFARRWLKGDRVDFALIQLQKAGAVHRYPVLWEVEGALVSQAEHTVVILEDRSMVITKT